MEPVSLSFGAAALVSLLATCVDCFEYIDAAKSCGRDLELLTTKFAIEKTRLLIWGESVGLSTTKAAGCTRIKSPHFRPIIEQILNCIRLLFEDTTALSDRYGLRPKSHNATVSVVESSSSHLTLPLRLKTSYIRFRSCLEQNHKDIDTSKKARWAIRDRQKFACLVEDIQQFIDGLEAVTDSVDLSTKRAALIREELSTVEDPEDLRLIAEASMGTNKQWSDAASIAIGASTYGGSGEDRIRDWMSEVSDYKMSTIANYEGPEPAWELLEADESSQGYSDDDPGGGDSPWRCLAHPQAPALRLRSEAGKGSNPVGENQPGQSQRSSMPFGRFGMTGYQTTPSLLPFRFDQAGSLRLFNKLTRDGHVYPSPSIPDNHPLRRFPSPYPLPQKYVIEQNPPRRFEIRDDDGWRSAREMDNVSDDPSQLPIESFDLTGRYTTCGGIPEKYLVHL
ncbi:MAG: hypothetical protein Q9186_006514 [Xanthomendoza sp. 1 TL-2023]